MQGDEVTISGADLIEGWKRESNGSWSAPINSEPNQMLRDGEPWSDYTYERAAKRLFVKHGDPRLHRFETVVRQQVIDLDGRKDVTVRGIAVRDTARKVRRGLTQRRVNKVGLSSR
jgi:hypothetical protein